MVRKIHHVGIVVRRLETAYRFYRDGLGLSLVREAELKGEGVRAALLAMGESAIELLEPINRGTGVQRFLEKRGEGLHHLCFETEDVGKDLAALRARGVPVIDEVPREGLAGLIAFLHPKATAGVLVELVSPLDRMAPRHDTLRMKRVVITSHDVVRACDLYSDLFQLNGKTVNGSRTFIDVGPAALLVVPADEAGGVEGMLALSLVSDDLTAMTERLQAGGVALRTGAGEITVEPHSSHGVHLHISRFNFP
jgi:methylmalonyl-CoA epimerase